MHNQLSRIAGTITASSLLLQAICQQQQDENRSLYEAAARQLRLHSEAVELAARRWQGTPAQPSGQLAMELATVMPEDSPAEVAPDELIDEYVCCHLGAISAALSALRHGYEISRESDPRVAPALFACLHWIESARQQLARILSSHSSAFAA